MNYCITIVTSSLAAIFLLVSSVSSQSCQVDLAFVVDNSGSIRDSNVAGQPDNFDQVTGFMKQLVQSLTVSNDGNRIGAVSFGNAAEVDFYLNQYTTTQQVVDAISRINYLGGNTNTTGGMRVMRQDIFNQANGDRPNVPNVCILITDGIPTREVELLPGEVQANKNLGTRIIGVGVSAAVNETQLKSVVSNPATDYFYVSNFTGLFAILDAIRTEACRTVPPGPSTATPPGNDLPFTVDTTACLVDVGFVVDNSGSIRDSNVAGQPDNFDLVKRFMVNIVQAVTASQQGNHFGCVSYGNEAKVNFYLNQYYTTDAVVNAINSIVYMGGNTNTTGGLRLMRTNVFTAGNGDRPNIPNLLILITDGITTREVDGLAGEVQANKNQGTRILGVGVSNAVNEVELKSIVSNPDTDYFYVSNFTGLYSLLNAIINRACQSFPSQPTLPPTPQPVPTSQTTATTVSPPTPAAQVSDIRTPAADTACQVDIGFVVDNSGSIRDSNVVGQPDNFNQVLDFMVMLVQRVTAAPNGNRFASVSFGNDARVDYYFNRYTTTDQVVGAIRSINYMGGNTNTTGALRLLRTSVFTEANGDRPEVPNVCLLITDGIPTREVAELPAEVQRIKDMGVRIIGVGVSKEVNETQLKSVVTNPATDYFFVSNFTGLFDVLDAIINRACQSFAPISTVSTTSSTRPSSSSPPTTQSSGTTASTTTTTTSRPPSTSTPTPVPTTAREPVGNCNNQVDIIFVLDDSGSIGYSNFALLRSFLSVLITNFDIENNNVRVGLVTFSNNTEPRFNLNTYSSRSSIRAVLSNMTYYGGGTNTPDVLNYVRQTMMTSQAGQRSGIPTFVCVITDGGSTDKKGTQDAAYALRNANATVVVVGIGQWLDMMELNNMASYPYTDNRIILNSYNDLPSIQSRLGSAACNGLGKCTNNPCQNGGTCTQDLSAYSCLCPSGFSGQNCEKRCRLGADVAFIIDSSSILGNDNFQKELDFVRQVVLSMNINTDSRVALITSADPSYIRFNLNDLNNKLKILNGISQYYSAGKSDLAGAIRLMRTQVFGGSGDRPNYPNVAVIITFRGCVNSTEGIQEAQLARAMGIQILGVGVGSLVQKDDLNMMVSYPATSNAVFVSEPASINNALTPIISAVCNEVNECSSSPCQNGGQCSDVINGYTCSCSNSFTGISCIQAGSSVMDINIVVDCSGSIRMERLPLVLKFISDIVSQLEIASDKTRIGLLQYSDTANEVFRLNTYNNKQDIMQAVQMVKFMGGRTNAADALRMLVNPMFTSAYGDRPNAPNIVLFFSDGNWNVKVPDTIPAAVAARAAGIHIITFSVGSDSNRENLEAISSPPYNYTVFQAFSSVDLGKLLSAVVNSFYNDVNECNSNPCQNGGSCVDDIKRYICRCSTGYSGDSCSRKCTRQMDVTLIMDRSQYLDPSIYSSVLPLARQIIQGLPISPSSVRAAVVTYDYNATVVCNLNTYTSVEDVLNSMSFDRSSSSRSNLQDSLRLLYQNIYTAGRGDRDSVDNVVVVLTDGFATPADPTPIADLANSARSQSGVEFFVVGLGDVQSTQTNIQALANNRNDHITYMRYSTDVTTAATQVLDRLCNPTFV